MIEGAKGQAVSAVVWSGLEVFLRFGMTFVVSIALARLLTPEEFGTIALVYLFVGLAGAFVDGGLPAALIQRQDVTHTDESTVFWFNFGAGALAAVLLWLAAPAIAAFYDRPVLVPLTGVLAISLFVGGIGSVHKTLLIKRLDFRKLLKIGAIATAVSSAVAVVLAWKGYGVWALAAQILTTGVMSTLLLWLFSPWRPALVFSLASARRLFGFGIYLLFSALLDTAYTRAYTVLIGKFHGVAALGLYSRAANTQQLPASILVGILSQVAFPVFSAAANDKARLRSGVRRALRGIMLINIPIMVGLAVTAEPAIIVLFGRQWVPAAPILQVLALAGIFWPLHVINLNVLIAQGHSDIFFRLEILKKIVGTLLLLGGSLFGVMGIAWSQVVAAMLSFLINAHYTRIYLGYGALEQLRDLASLLAVSAVMALVVIVVEARLVLPPGAELPILVVGGAGVFLMLAFLLRLSPFIEGWQAVRGFLMSRNASTATP